MHVRAVCRAEEVGGRVGSLLVFPCVHYGGATAEFVSLMVSPELLSACVCVNTCVCSPAWLSSAGCRVLFSAEGKAHYRPHRRKQH